MKILIVGAGVGGLTLAGFLKDSAIDFELIDKKADESPQGFSLGLWNNGRNILAKLGLAERFDYLGSRIRHYRVCDGKGELLKKYDLSEFYSEYGVAYTHIDRAALYKLLLDLTPLEKINFKTEISQIKQKSEKIEVAFSNGEIKEYDLVVGADGIHSQVRELAFAGSYELFDNWRVWYAWIDNTFKQNAAVTEYIEPGEFVGVFDVGSRTLAVLIAPAKHSVWDDVAGRLERLNKLFKNESVLSGFLRNLKNEDISPTDLSHVKMKRWVNGRSVLLGDAAHGFEPHAGLGASMAMEDGYVLAGELIKVSETYSIEKALENYQKIRAKRVGIARTLTNRMRAWAFVKSRPLRKIINILIKLIPQSFFVNKYHQLLREEI
ncbi:MAG: NAD(P)/FAD-dependent oxidoreductase [Patescibacteria group bacterium]